MKLRYIGAGILMLLAVSEAQARRNYGMAGCGLGSVIFGPRGGQISAATTNGTYWNQTFGISSGTSGCLPDDKAAAMQSQEQFLVANYATLSKEMAQGQGPALESLADTLGCTKPGYPHFAQEMQGSYDRIFAAPGAIATLERVRETIERDPVLASTCVDAIL